MDKAIPEREAYLRDAARVVLNECTQAPERRILLLVVPDFVQRLAPSLNEVRQQRRDQARVHQTDASY